MRRGFTLLEVVVAVGVFAVGMVAVIALFAPVSKWESESGDVGAAIGVADALALKLEGQPLGEVAALLKHSTPGSHQLLSNDHDPNGYRSRDDVQMLFASRDGFKIGVYSDRVWVDAETGLASDREKFFEIALLRNEALAPIGSENDLTSPLLAYTARLRWPAFVPDRGSGAIEIGANLTGVVQYDHRQQRVMFLAGVVRR